MNRTATWTMRGAWLLLPLLSGPLFGDALDDRSRMVQLVVSTAMWVVWAGVLVAALVPRTVSLTVVRVVAPAGALAAAIAVTAADDSVIWQAVGLGWTLAATVVAFTPAVGQEFIDGSSYGEEHRFPLRVPGPMLLGFAPLIWLVLVGAAVAPVLLLASRMWVVGAVLLLVGWPLAWYCARILHELARRWVVLVPAGMVLHDPMALAEPILLRRTQVRSLAPAPAETDATDVTHGALGLALEADLIEPVPLALNVGRTTETKSTERLLFTPTRPGVFLAAAHSRRLGSA